MDDKLDGIVSALLGYNIEFQQSVINQLILCALFFTFLIWTDKRFEGVDVRKMSSGILLITEITTGLCTNTIEDNPKHEAKHYLSFPGILAMMTAVSNLLGLLGLQSPTSNSSFNATPALMMFLTIQYNGIKKGGFDAHLRELMEPTWLLTSLSVISELALLISLSMHLSGNILAGSIVMLLVHTTVRSFLPFGVLGYIATPFLHVYFDVFSGLIRTYIFFTLASFFPSEQVAPGE